MLVWWCVYRDECQRRRWRIVACLIWCEEMFGLGVVENIAGLACGVMSVRGQDEMQMHLCISAFVKCHL